MSEIPNWAWVAFAGLVGPLVFKLLDVLFSRVVHKEDERSAAFDKKLEELTQSVLHLREYVRDRFDQLNARREEDSKILTERLHELEKNLPDLLRRAKHDAINEVAPRLGRLEERLNSFEVRLARAEAVKPVGRE